jgi:hypothetical protein
MSELPLPDDLAQWPDDPNELLGVSFGVTPRELRRVYNRLIRIYKPEQFPEQFRRIREAYERLLRTAELFAPRAEAVDSPPAEEPQLLPTPKEQSSDEGSTEWIAGSPRSTEEASDEEAVPARTRRPKEELDELWESAIAGRPGAAYERLTQLTQQHAGRTELYQRLYWLLTLWPDLDARRVPADWLVQGLLATGLAGSLRELYREEVADNPAEALSERYERLLGAPISTALLADLIEWRFQAAMRLERWNVLIEDLPRLRPRFGLGEEQLWLRLLFSLADRVVWAIDAEGERLLAACRAGISSHEYVARGMPYFFDRFDLLLEASAGWQKLKLCHQGNIISPIWRLAFTPIDGLFKYRRRIPAAFLRLIGVSWSRPLAEVRESLMEVLEAITTSPRRWLNHLDEMRERAPATLALFGELLDRFEKTREGEAERCDGDVPSGLVLAFLSRLRVANYQKTRKRLLLFCIRENLAPEAIAEVASSWTQALMADWPLRYVCRACRLFWA